MLTSNVNFDVSYLEMCMIPSSSSYLRKEHWKSDILNGSNRLQPPVHMQIFKSTLLDHQSFHLKFLIQIGLSLKVSESIVRSG